MSKKEPDGWRILVSMDQMHAEHPEWTDDECQEEMQRQMMAHVDTMLAKQADRRQKRAAKRVINAALGE